MKKLAIGLLTMCACVVCNGDAMANNAKPEVPSFFTQMDTNKDNKISKAEAKDRIAENFDALDTNKDGFITLQELNSNDNRPARGEGAGSGNGFSEMDKNKDNKVSKAEATGRIAENFDSIDTNKDGFITREELNASRPKQ